jgi:molybdopterin molybdotransferase
MRYLASSNCLIDVPVDVTELPAGAQVQIWQID